MQNNTKYSEMCPPNLYLFVGVTLAIWLLVVQYFRWCITFWDKRNVYTPKSSIPFGNAVNFILQRRTQGEELKKVYETIKGEGKPYGGYYIFAKPIFIPVDLDLIKRILITDFDHFTDHIAHVNVEAEPLAGNVFCLSGSKWKRMRAKLNPAFTPGKMKMMFHAVAQRAAELVEVVDKQIEGNELIDVKDVSARFAIDVIGCCGFGADFNTLQNPDSKFRKYTKMIFSGSPWDSAVRLVSFSTPEILSWFKLRTFKREVHEFFVHLVEQTVGFRENQHVISKDFIHLLIQMKNNVEISEHDLGDIKNRSSGSMAQSLSLNEMAAQAFSFFTGGFETSSSTMTYCLYELAESPDIQENVREEIKMILGMHGGKLTYEALGEMSYLESCVCETLRKYPILPVSTRKCTKTYRLPNSDLVLEEGSVVFIPVMGIHYDPDYFPEPQKFDPGRFSPERKSDRHLCAWIPFGEGPRVCLGARFGMMQVKVALIFLLKNFRFSLNKQTKLPIVMNPRSLSLNPRWPLWFDAERV